MNSRTNWLLGFGLFFGIPTYVSGLPFEMAFLIHLCFIAVYVILLRDFGSDSCIEVGVILSIIAVLVALLAPAFFSATQRAKLNKQRQQHRQNINVKTPITNHDNIGRP